ncbi:antitermination protein Q, partial [Escherichia coli]
PSGKNIIRWLLKKRTNGSVRYCQYTSRHYRIRLPERPH